MKPGIGRRVAVIAVAGCCASSWAGAASAATVATPVTKPAAKPVVEPVAKSVATPVVTSGREAGDQGRLTKPVVKAAAKPVVKAAAKPVVKAAAKPVVCGTVTRAHREALGREKLLSRLVGSLQRAPDPFGLNARQLSTLDQARSGIAALDQQISAIPCDAKRAVADPLVNALVGYRVYWLRLPQTRLIEAYDHLEAARQDLTQAMARRRVSASDRQYLLQAASTLGGAGGFIGGVASLGPISQMHGDETVLRSAWKRLEAASRLLARSMAGVPHAHAGVTIRHHAKRLVPKRSRAGAQRSLPPKKSLVKRRPQTTPHS